MECHDSVKSEMPVGSIEMKLDRDVGKEQRLVSDAVSECFLILRINA